jgi:hypothetical protein
MRAFASGLAGAPASGGVFLAMLGWCLAGAAHAELLTHHDLPWRIHGRNATG